VATKQKDKQGQQDKLSIQLSLWLKYWVSQPE